MPNVFFAGDEVNAWDRSVKRLLLRADDLIAPSNLLLAVESTFKWHRAAALAWTAQQEAKPAGARYDERPSILLIVDEWETIPELRHVFGEMIQGLCKRSCDYSSIPYAQRAVVNGFLRLPPKASGRAPGSVDDASRKRKRDGATAADLDANRARLRKEMDAESVRLVREFDTRCAKCLRDGHSSLRTHAHLCSPGTAHTDTNS